MVSPVSQIQPESWPLPGPLRSHGAFPQQHEPLQCVAQCHRPITAAWFCVLRSQCQWALRNWRSAAKARGQNQKRHHNFWRCLKLLPESPWFFMILIARVMVLGVDDPNHSGVKVRIRIKRRIQGWHSDAHDNTTSSTAQGGGGSLKNGKPTGKVGCCDSRMAERIHWWTERWLELCFLEWLQWLQWSRHHNCWM